MLSHYVDLLIVSATDMVDVSWLQNLLNIAINRDDLKILEIKAEKTVSVDDRKTMKK